MSTSYKANIEFSAYKDDYNDGEDLDCINYWHECYTTDTKSDLKKLIIAATYQNTWADFDDEQINEYDFATEYATTYLADADNEGDASKAQIAEWQAGKLDLYTIHCHVLVTKVIEKKAVL